MTGGESVRATVAVVVTVGSSDVELVSDALFGLGARAVEERVGKGGSSELVCILGEGHADLNAALTQLGVKPRVRLEPVDETTLHSWRDHARPIDVDARLLIRPAWFDMATPAPTDRLVIDIDPGAAFGLGDHPTTVLSALAVLDEMAPGSSVLDMGCGSGVLGIIAAKCGAASVLSIDIDGAAIEATSDNARRNGAADRITVVRSDRVPEGTNSVDLICANILAPVLVTLAPNLVSAMAPGGRLILSGLLTDNHVHVIDRYRSLGLVSTTRRDLDGWHVEVMRRD